MTTNYFEISMFCGYSNNWIREYKCSIKYLSYTDSRLVKYNIVIVLSSTWWIAYTILLRNVYTGTTNDSFILSAVIGLKYNINSFFNVKIDMTNLKKNNIF